MSSGLSTALNILTRWQCTPLQALAILQIPANRPFPEELSDVQCERVSYVLNIHNDLDTVFEDPEYVYGFMSRPNQDPFFAGRSPLEMISSGDLTTLEQVCWHIDALRTR